MLKNKPCYIKRMKGQDYIDATRKYLDYLEEHLNNVALAFDELSKACDGKEYWVGDDYSWLTFKYEVEQHDLSKFTKEEFVQYRDKFFPVTQEDKDNSEFDKAWKNHKLNNQHHHETANNYMDIVHMVIDWIAMSYKFKDDPKKFYYKTKPSMTISTDHHAYIEKLFGHLENYRLSGEPSKKRF